eukprot:357425-Chlamydomonas_euryale.AAC.2
MKAATAHAASLGLAAFPAAQGPCRPPPARRRLRKGCRSSPTTAGRAQSAARVPPLRRTRAVYRSSTRRSPQHRPPVRPLDAATAGAHATHVAPWGVARRWGGGGVPLAPEGSAAAAVPHAYAPEAARAHGQSCHAPPAGATPEGAAPAGVARRSSGLAQCSWDSVWEGGAGVWSRGAEPSVEQGCRALACPDGCRELRTPMQRCVRPCRELRTPMQRCVRPCSVAYAHAASGGNGVRPYRVRKVTCVRAVCKQERYAPMQCAESSMCPCSP